VGVLELFALLLEPAATGIFCCQPTAQAPCASLSSALSARFAASLKRAELRGQEAARGTRRPTSTRSPLPTAHFPQATLPAQRPSRRPRKLEGIAAIPTAPSTSCLSFAGVARSGSTLPDRRDLPRRGSAATPSHRSVHRRSLIVSSLPNRHHVQGHPKRQKCHQGLLERAGQGPRRCAR